MPPRRETHWQVPVPGSVAFGAAQAAVRRLAREPGLARACLGSPTRLSASYLQEGLSTAVFLLESEAGASSPAARFVVNVQKRRGVRYRAHREFELLARHHARRPDEVVRPLWHGWAGALPAYATQFYPAAAECNLWCSVLSGRFACTGYRLMVGGGASPFWRGYKTSYFGPEDQRLIARETARLLAATYDPARGTAVRLRSEGFFSGDVLFLDDGEGRFRLKLVALRESVATSLDGFLDALIRLRVRSDDMPAAVPPFLNPESLAEGALAALGRQALPGLKRRFAANRLTLAPAVWRRLARPAARRGLRLSRPLSERPSLEAGSWTPL
ncbi:MAG: hypothetical protein ACHQ2Z_09110 [Elusimicrobiota bacterium]